MNPICTYYWFLVLAFHQQMKDEEKEGVKDHGFKVSPGRIRRDGSVLPPIKSYYVPGDPAIPRIIGALYGYDK
ncbi:hypothetical protein M0R72_06205 [Candidatus Pacearchaeota archaeon]|nr:hypothetical protein [Candidatus Pacearchaeota archaeon]